MAKIGSTNDSNDIVKRKYYTGLGNFKIIAINPDKKQRDEIYGRVFDDEPKYVSEDQNGNKRAHVVIYCKCQNEGIDLIIPKTFLITDKDNVSKTNKVEYIDKFADNKWSETPISADEARIAKPGEVRMMQFLKTWLVIPGRNEYKNGQWVERKNLNEAVFMLENVDNLFKGDFSEIKELLALRPDNIFTGLATVRTTDKGMFQDLYDVIAAGPDNNGNQIIKSVNKQIDSGYFNGIETDFLIIHEYSNKPTDLSVQQNLAAPEDMNEQDEGDSLPF